MLPWEVPLPHGNPQNPKPGRGPDLQAVHGWWWETRAGWCVQAMRHRAGFIAVVWQRDVDQQFMHQVVPPYWHQSSDFYNYVFGYYVQVDGCVHWRGMYRYTSTDVLQADFGQALSALEQGATLVRIHAADLNSQDLVAATLTAGQGFVGIVLSPAYACQQVCYQSQSLPYIQALVGVNTNLLLSWGPTGSILISKK